MIKIIIDNNVDYKNNIHMKLRKNNRDKCKWLCDNVSSNIEKKILLNIIFMPLMVRN